MESAAKQGGSLIVGGSSDISTLNPILASDDLTFQVVGSIFETLAGGSPIDGTPVPGLADSWDVSPDGMTYIFHISQTARWQDGVDVTAEDVKFSFDAALNPNTGSRYTTLFNENIASYRVVDENTFEVTARDHFVSFLQNGPASIFIVPKHIWEQVDFAVWSFDDGSTGRDASRVIALWKDPTTGVREIPLEPGAHGVLLTVAFDRATRYAADRRWPVDNSTFASGVAVHQVHAADAGSPAQPVPPTAATMPLLETEELTILTAWAEGVSEAAAYAPDRVGELLAQARTGSAWRAELGLPELSPRLADAIESLGRVVGRVAAPAGTSLFNALITVADEDHLDENTVDGLVRHVLLSMLEERRTRQSTGPSAGR